MLPGLNFCFEWNFFSIIEKFSGGLIIILKSEIDHFRFIKLSIFYLYFDDVLL